MQMLFSSTAFTSPNSIKTPNASEQSLQTPNTEKNLNTSYLSSPQSLKTETIQTPREALSEKQVYPNPKTLHLSTKQLTNRFNSAESNVRGGVSQKNMNLTELETLKIQGKTSGLSSYEPASTEHLIKPQPQAKRDVAKQVDQDSATFKAVEKPVASDLNSLADKIYQLIERKAKIERERRG
jgi:hypothetical protein